MLSHLTWFILDEGVENSTSDVQGNAEHRKYIDADSPKSEHTDPGLNYGFKGPRYARRQCRVIRRTQEEQVV